MFPVSIIFSMSELGRLEDLNLLYNSLSVDAVKVISRIPSLKKLGLRSCSLTDLPAR